MRFWFSFDGQGGSSICRLAICFGLCTFLFPFTADLCNGLNLHGHFGGLASQTGLSHIRWFVPQCLERAECLFLYFFLVALVSCFKSGVFWLCVQGFFIPIHYPGPLGSCSRFGMLCCLWAFVFAFGRYAVNELLPFQKKKKNNTNNGEDTAIYP